MGPEEIEIDGVAIDATGREFVIAITPEHGPGPAGTVLTVQTVFIRDLETRELLPMPEPVVFRVADPITDSGPPAPPIVNCAYEVRLKFQVPTFSGRVRVKVKATLTDDDGTEIDVDTRRKRLKIPPAAA